MTGTLKARVGASWVPINGSGQEAANTARWNSAWGVVSVGTFRNVSNVQQPSDTRITNTLTFTGTVGRRYMLRCRVRGLSAGGDGHIYLQLIYDGANSIDTHQAIYPSTALGHGIYDQTFTGDGASHTYDIKIVGQVFTPYVDMPTAYFFIEDMGPVTPASIAPPAAQPRVVASGNALGIVAMGVLSAGNPVITAGTYGNVTQELSVFWAVGRRYRVVFSTRATTVSTFPSAVMCRLSLNPGVPTTEKWRAPSTSYEGFDTEWVYDGDDTYHSLSVQMQSQQGSLTVFTDFSGWFYCEDVGPNTYPALPIPATPPPWSALTLQSGWVAVPGEVPRYRKVGDMVQLRGSASVSGNYTPNLALTTFPAGFRPGQSWCRLGLNAFKASVGGCYQIRGHINGTDGTFQLAEYTNPDQANAQVALDNIQFCTTP